MDTADLRESVEFEEGDVVRKALFESDRLFSQLLCLDRNASLGPISDPDSDAMLTILAGEAVFLVGGKRKRMRQWGAVVVPAGSELVVTNASTEPLVVLMVVTPPPRAES